MAVKGGGTRSGGLASLRRVLGDGRGRLLLGLGAAGVLLVLLSGLFATAAPTPAPVRSAARGKAGRAASTTRSAPPPAAAASAGGDPILAYEALVDRAVGAVLDQVAGAGTVTVAVTVARSPSRVLVRDLSQSREQQGATASSSVDEALAYGKNKVPVSTGEVAAPIVGALVVAPGASDPVVRAELTEAVQTLLGLGANQVIVLPGRKERSR